jgi:hypothetical protein
MGETVAASGAAQYARTIRRAFLSCVLVVFTATACGGGKPAAGLRIVTRTATPYAAAVCLNSDTFVVSQAGREISGSSPGGVNFTIRFYKSPAAAAAALSRLNAQYAAAIAATVVDYAGNPPLHPGGAPMILTHDEFATLRHCIELHFPG